MSPNRTVAEQLQITRRWLITLVSLLITIQISVLLLGAAQLITTLGNRHAGQGNRKVSCVILDRVDPQTQLAECTATAANRR